MTVHAERILIIDFGSQVTQLIARRVREAGVYCEIKPFNSLGEGLTAPGLKGIILSGGPASVGDEGSPRCLASVTDRCAWSHSSAGSQQEAANANLVGLLSR